MAGGIVVPLDGSRFAEAALPAAMRFARRDGRAIVLVAISELPRTLDAWPPALQELEDERQVELGQYLVQVARRVEEAAGVPVSIVERRGSAPYLLPQLLGELEPGVVVMSTHGHGGLTRMWLGSVADRVVRKGGVPVFLVRPEADLDEVALEPAPPIRRMVVALDGSEVAETALRKSILVGNHGASVEILLLRVLGFPLPSMSPRITELRRGVAKADADEAEAYLARVAAQIAPWGAKVTTHVSEQASPWTGIPAFAVAHDADLIVMATHGRGGPARFVLGSVADRVIRTAEIPVLIVPPVRVQVESEGIEQLAGQLVGMP
jgi:nucleotide-binding universal stress UspA family protein